MNPGCMRPVLLIPRTHHEGRATVSIRARQQYIEEKLGTGIKANMPQHGVWQACNV